MDRRTFIKAVGALGASLFLQTYRSDIAKALQLSETKVMWLHGVMDSGCTISMLDGGSPDIVEFLQVYNLKLLYHEVLMMQQGIFVDGKLANTSDLNSEILLDEILGREKGYVLVHRFLINSILDCNSTRHFIPFFHFISPRKKN
jgi:F420-nonreducing hydrogenase I